MDSKVPSFSDIMRQQAERTEAGRTTPSTPASDAEDRPVAVEKNIVNFLRYKLLGEESPAEPSTEPNQLITYITKLMR